MSIVQQYIDYFKAFAVTHPKLKHEAANGKRAFKSVTINQAFNPIQGLKSKGFVLITILPSIRHDDDFKYYEGGFAICGYANSTNDEAVEKIIIETDAMVDELVYSMRAASREGHGLFEGSFNKTKDTDVRAHNNFIDPNYYGWMVLFPFFHDFRCLPKPTLSLKKDFKDENGITYLIFSGNADKGIDGYIWQLNEQGEGTAPTIKLDTDTLSAGDKVQLTAQIGIQNITATYYITEADITPTDDAGNPIW